MNAQKCIDAGTDALSVINTVTGMAVDVESKTPIISNDQAGLSGPAIKPIALLKVHEVYQVAKKYEIPIIGQGGVINAQDAIEFLIAGASAVGIGTGLFYDPLICGEINKKILEYMGKNSISNIQEITGSLVLNKSKTEPGVI